MSSAASSSCDRDLVVVHEFEYVVEIRAFPAQCFWLVRLSQLRLKYWARGVVLVLKTSHLLFGACCVNAALFVEMLEEGEEVE